MTPLFVIPVKAGICPGLLQGNDPMFGRIPTCAGMTMLGMSDD